MNFKEIGFSLNLALKSLNNCQNRRLRAYFNGKTLFFEVFGADLTDFCMFDRTLRVFREVLLNSCYYPVFVILIEEEKMRVFF
jgi:hypothetical protein